MDIYEIKEHQRHRKNHRKMLTFIIIITSIAIILLSREPSEITSESQPVNNTAAETLLPNKTNTTDTANDSTLATLAQIPLIIPKTKPFTFTHWKSSKGASIYFKQTPEIPMLDIQITFLAGSAQTPAKKAGLAMLTSELLPEGTQQYDATEIAQKLEAVGAILSTGSAKDAAYISLRSLSDPEFKTKALALFADVIGRPAFQEETYKRILNVMRLNLDTIKQNPSRLLSHQLMSILYKEHPYGHPTTGTKEGLNNLSLSDVKSFYNTFYVAKNATIAIVGDLSKTQAKNIAESITKHLKSGAPAPQIPDAPAAASTHHQHIDYPSQQTHIAFAITSVKKGDPNNPYLFLANDIFGGGGFNAILTDKIREQRGLSYSVGSYYSSMLAEGPFIINLQTKNETAREAIQLVQKELTEYLNTGPTEKQLTLARSNIISSKPLQLSNNASLVSYLSNTGFYQLPDNHLEMVHEKISTATREQLMSVFKKIVKPDSLVLVTLGPQNPLDKKNSDDTQENLEK